MSADEIRKRFLDFFESKKHTIVPSASLVPPEAEDRTVLFTTAGMQQFKRQFLGQGVTYRRAASSQKCLRTDDLDKVGKTAFHHTFFEMLGNFSFGDYFKKEAIEWAWEFLTKELKIPKDKLWVSVYKDDDEAYQIWVKDIKISKEKIVKLGDKSNFWPSEAKEKGPNGPCGPCSEIFFDYGVNPNCPNGKDCNPDCNCGRFSEVWNLVFTQYNRKDDGALEPLPGKNIDTGMGFERLVAVVQGKKSNYETDLFASILETIDKKIIENRSLNNPSERLIIADHIRAIVFAISDGVIPSNDGRGYIVKKLIIESSDIALRRYNSGKPTIYRLVPIVVDIMNAAYPELKQKRGEIAQIIEATEEAYIRVLGERIPQLEKELQSTSAQDRGKILFRYRDTFGLTLDSIQDALKAAKINEVEQKLALADYYKLMEQQKTRSRAASKMTGDVFADAELKLNDIKKTEFLGYDQNESKGKILKLFVESKEVGEAKQGDTVKIILDKTPFYAESGGQIGDTGYITKDNSTIRVLDTKKIADVYIHFGKVEKNSFKTGADVQAKIEAERRLSIMRNHTATHLLQAALRKILGTHIKQQGSLVAEDRLRFDFTHPQAIPKEKLLEIEALINDFISKHDKVSKESMAIEEAKKSGALAFFAEKYGNTVRVVTIDGYSKEFCGGTHLDNTSEIGQLKITSEGAIAQGIRRIEAVTGTFVKNWMKTKEAEELLRQRASQEKQKEKEQSDKNFEKIKDSIDAILKEGKNMGTINVIRHHFKNLEPELLRKISELIKQKAKSAVIAIAGESNGSASIIIAVTDDLVAKGIKASDIIKEVAPLIGGSGGGRAEVAQAGSKDASKLNEALQHAEELIKKRLGA